MTDAASALYLGMISGTSADGIDVALARFHDAADGAPPRAEPREERQEPAIHPFG